MPETDFNKKPSFTFGYLPGGEMELIAAGDAQTALDAFNAERETLGKGSKFVRLAYFKKIRPEKLAKEPKVENTRVDVDLSEWDGKEIPAEELAKIEEQSNAAAAAVITGEPPEKKESSARSPRPKKKRAT